MLLMAKRLSRYYLVPSLALSPSYCPSSSTASQSVSVLVYQKVKIPPCFFGKCISLENHYGIQNVGHPSVRKIAFPE